MGTARDHGITRLYSYQPAKVEGLAKLEHLEGMLHENHIYCSTPKGFNDPWDCKPYFDPSSVDDPVQRAGWGEYFNSLLSLEEQSVMSAALGPGWQDNPDLLRRSIEQTTKAVVGNNAGNFRVFCLTYSPKSLLMWAHYASKHEGFCLEFDMTKEKLWRARRVVYGDKLPLLNADTMKHPLDSLAGC